MNPINEKYLVIDLEATCDRDNRLRRDQMEIIEIGGVLVNPNNLTIEREFQTFVRPIRNPILRPFCTELTSITQDQVDDAPLFPEAILQLRDFLEGERAVFCSWGAYDRNQFRQDAQFHRVRLPFDDRKHINLKQEFAKALKLRRGMGLARALKRVGLPFEGSHHRGIDDARNIARLLPWILGWKDTPEGQTARKRGHNVDRRQRQRRRRRR